MGKTTRISILPLRTWPLWAHHAVALVIMAFALALRWMLDPILGDRLPLLTVLSALMVLIVLVRPSAFLLAAVLGMTIAIWLFVLIKGGTPMDGAIGTAAWLVAISVTLAFAATWLSHRSRHRLEAFMDRLSESEARFRTMADGLPLIVWVHGPNGDQEFVNKTFCEFFGVKPAEMHGERWKLLMHPEDAESYSNEFAACVRDRRPFNASVRVKKADGEWRWIESWARPRFSESGEFLGFVGSSVDITERKMGDALISKHRNELEDLVARRTRELQRSNEQLRRAETLAALGELSRGLSHDMSNLLFPLEAHLAVLEREQLTPQGRESVGSLKRSVNYLRDLSLQLRNRITNESPQCDGESPRDVIDPGQWCDETAQFLRSVLPAQVAFDCSCQPNLPPIKSNKAAFTQAMYNLVQNSGQMIEEHRIGSRVDVRFETVDHHLRIVVEDDGPGMTDEVRRQCLTTNFTTGARSSGGGSGIGLLLVRSFVNSVNGSLDIQSPPAGTRQRGTAVVMKIPINDR